VLSRALRAARDSAGGGPRAALDAARTELGTEPRIEIDYLVVTDPELGELPAEVSPGTEGRILVAGRIGSTRLIDNMPLTFGVDPAAEGRETSPEGTR
jgi:pantoate--beta-alanine ligase